MIYEMQDKLGSSLGLSLAKVCMHGDKYSI